MWKLSKILLASLAIYVGTNANADTYTISTSLNPLQPGTDNQGWWLQYGGNNNPVNDNYITGFYSYSGPPEEYRSFFSFDLSGVSGTVTAATFNVRRYTQTSGLTLGLFDVSTPASTLITTRQDVSNPAIFTDLGTGTSYGSFLVGIGASTDILSFSLNANALANLNAAAGVGYFSIGAAVLSGSGYIFGESSAEPGNSGGGYNSIQELVLTTTSVPEPSTSALVGLAGLLMVGWRRK